MPLGTISGSFGGGFGTALSTADDQAYRRALLANKRRMAQAMSLYDEIISRYRPGGEFGKAALGQLEARKVREVGAEKQQLISSNSLPNRSASGSMETSSRQNTCMNSVKRTRSFRWQSGLECRRFASVTTREG